MKNLFILFYVLIASTLNGQDVDSISIQQVDSLIKVCRELASQNAFEKAYEIIQIAEKLCINRLGKLTASYGSCCFNKGRIYYLQNNLAEAEKWYIEAKEIREKTLGKKHPDYAWSLNNLGSLYKDQGKFTDAEKYYIESKIIRENYFGNQHPEYINSLNNLGILYWQTGQYVKAEQAWTECKNIREKTLGKDHPDYAWSLFNLAVLFRDQGNYIPAESLTLQSIAIQKKVFGTLHPSYAAAINGLALIYYLMGSYEKAEPLYKESIVIREKTLGKENAEYAWSLNNLANLYIALCDYERAEILMLECKEIREKVLGKQHHDFAASLNNLGILYISMGRFIKAEKQYLECKSLRELYEGKLHPEYANVLTNLASLYKSIGKYDKSEIFLLETIEIRKKVLGTEHPDYATSLFNLSELYKSIGKFDKAMALIQECLTIWKEKLGNQHPTYATGILNLADLYVAKRQFDIAESLYKESKIIYEKVIGIEHPSYGLNIYNLAELYEKLQRYSESEQLFQEHFALQQEQLSKGISYLSENELVSYAAILKDKDNNVNSIMFNRNSDINKNYFTVLPSLIYDQTLFYRGFVLSSVARLNSLSKMTLEAEEISNLLKSKRRLLAKEYSKPIAVRNKVNDLEEEANNLEKELSRTIAGYNDMKQLVTWNEVRAALKPGEVAMEFVSFAVNFQKSLDSIMYAALVLKPGNNHPLFIPLFEEKSLDSLLYFNPELKADYVNGLYTIANRGAVVVDPQKRSLYEIIWRPLEKELSRIKTIYFSPSGLLHRINLNAIPISDTETLADKYKLIELGSTRQLVIPTKIKNVNNAAFLYGGIQFEQDSTLQNNEPLIASRSRGEFSFSSTDSTLRGGTWNYLSGTEREVNSIEKIMEASGLKVNLKKGYFATEESFKNIGVINSPSPRILHIATHGYFFPDSKESRQSSVVSRQEESVFKLSEHPMLRSGLIMAGGNAAWQGIPSLEGREDGILTAYEISQMNLSNTELVVLSACETGLGDIQRNEGVYGLQRAFKIAGVKYLIMSLWQVPDKQTSMLMISFYKKWLENKMTIPNAFHAAQKELREIGLDPYQWAGFVLVE